jgi:hypothetical protein
MIAMPVAATAATYAIGTVFVKHFESGGTFLTINMRSMTAQVSDIANQYRASQQAQ